GGFWIIYEGLNFYLYYHRIIFVFLNEASQPNAEVHLQCGPRKTLGIPSEELFTSPPPVSSSYTHGWNRLVYNDPPNPKGLINDHIMHIQSVAATSRSFLDRNFKNNSSTTLASAFTYPYGNLTTFELAYGPRGWFLKYPLNSSNMTATKVLQSTTTELPVFKWNSTWRYIRRLRTRVFVTTTTTSTSTTTTITTTTLSTTTITTPTTTLELTTIIIPTSTSMLITTEQDIIPLSSTMIPITTSPQSISVEQHLTVTDESRVYDSTTDTQILTTMIPNIQSTINLPASSFMLKTTIPTATPYYPPDGPFDWWQWQGYNKKFSTLSLKILTTTTTTTTTPTTTTTIETSISSTQTSTTTASTTRASTSLSARNRIMKLSNTTRTIPITSTNAATVDWFKWPQIESSSSTTRTTTTTARSDYYDDDYFEWLDSVETNKYQTTITTNPLLSIVPLSQGKQYQQMSFLPTKSNQNINNYGMMVNTPSSKRYNTQQNISTIYGKDSLAKNQLNEEITNITESRNKKDSEEYGWLSKTDMMIVTVSVLFVILLVFINIILFAVRRHRHRLQGRHLLSTSFPSSTNNRSISNNQLHSAKLGDSTDSLINITNNNNNDILPAVGEIVLWDEKDQGGYTIDNHGEWAKIEGRQWLANDNILENSGKLSSFSKSFRSHFQFMRQSNKKSNHGHQHVPASPKIQQQQISTFPLPVDTTTLSPVPEADDYQSSEFSSSDRILRNSETKPKNSNKKHQEAIKAVQALIHTEYNHSDDYYKRIESGGDDSNYTTMHENAGEEYSIADQQTDRSLGNETDVGGSVIISVPTMLKREDDIGIITDGVDSIYNQNYSIHSRETTNQSNYLQTNNTKLFTSKQSTKTFKPITNNSIIVGHCQTDILPLDPKIFDKTLLAEHHQFYSCSQSLQFSTYDSGFFDDQTINSLPMTLTNEPISNDNISSSETNDNSSPNSLSKRNLKTIRQKQTYTVKL
ncbi:unnamed protein product, partial [Adineta steineri]